MRLTSPRGFATLPALLLTAATGATLTLGPAAVLAGEHYFATQQDRGAIVTFANAQDAVTATALEHPGTADLVAALDGAAGAGRVSFTAGDSTHATEISVDLTRGGALAVLASDLAGQAHCVIEYRPTASSGFAVRSYLHNTGQPCSASAALTCASAVDSGTGTTTDPWHFTPGVSCPDPTTRG